MVEKAKRTTATPSTYLNQGMTVEKAWEVSPAPLPPTMYSLKANSEASVLRPRNLDPIETVLRRAVCVYRPPIACFVSEPCRFPEVPRDFHLQRGRSQRQKPLPRSVSFSTRRRCEAHLSTISEKCQKCPSPTVHLVASFGAVRYERPALAGRSLRGAGRWYRRPR